MSQPKQLSPIIFDFDVALTLNRGPIAIPEGFNSKARGPMLVDEIRFVPDSNASVIYPLTRVTLYVGRQVICEDMPLELLCMPLNEAVETGELNELFGGSNGNNQTQAVHIFRFPRPMFLPDDGRIYVKLALDNSAGQWSGLSEGATMKVAFVGRSLPENTPNDRLVFVPFASRWLSAVGGAIGASLVDQSQASDLRNTKRYPLYVKRFTYSLVGVGMYTDGSARNGIVDAIGEARDCLVRLYGANGILGVRDQTPVGVLMSRGYRSWVVNSVLEPNGYYIADVEYTAVNIANVRLGIGMIGHHQIPVNEIGAAL